MVTESKHRNKTKTNEQQKKTKNKLKVVTMLGAVAHRNITREIKLNAAKHKTNAIITAYWKIARAIRCGILYRGDIIFFLFTTEI